MPASRRAASIRAALGLVVFGKLGIKLGRQLLEAGGGGVLKGRGRADVGEVVEVGHGGHPLGGCGDVAEAPAGDGEGLRESRHDDGALAHAFERGGADVPVAVVEEVLVNLIGEEEEVVLAAGGGDCFDLRQGEDLAAGVGGGVEQDGAGARGDGGLERVGVEVPVRLGQRHQDGLDAHGFEGGGVVAVKRLEQEHFVAGIEQGHAGGVESAGGSAGHQDFGFRIVAEAVVALLFFRDGVAQAGDAIEARIDVVAGADGGVGFGLDDCGDGSVADSLGQVDAADAVAFGGHGADFRLHGSGG